MKYFIFCGCLLQHPGYGGLSAVHANKVSQWLRVYIQSLRTICLFVHMFLPLYIYDWYNIMTVLLM